MGYLYKITNTVNNKCYIGVTIQPDVKKRWNKHINSINYKEGCPLLKRAMKKYGIDKFRFDILIICFDSDVVKYEKEYIIKFNSQQPNGYNILSGGQIGDGFVGYKHSPETIEKIKEKGRIFRENNPNHFETYREKLKKSMEQLDLSNSIKNSEKFKQAMIDRKESYKNGEKSVSDETKNKISESLMKYYHTHSNNNINKHQEIMTKRLGKPIIQYDKEGIIIKEYPSIAEADRNTGVKHNNIKNVLYGKTKTAGGFIWKYK